MQGKGLHNRCLRAFWKRMKLGRPLVEKVIAELSFTLKAGSPCACEPPCSLSPTASWTGLPPWGCAQGEVCQGPSLGGLD